MTTPEVPDRATRTFIDTNVFLYATGRPHPLREPCRRVLRRLADGTLDGATSVEVVQEIVYVLGRRGAREDALQLARRVIALFPDLLPVTCADMSLACDMFADHADLPPRDAVHAATMRNNAIVQILSADNHFDSLPDLRRVDPADVTPPEP